MAFAAYSRAALIALLAITVSICRPQSEPASEDDLRRAAESNPSDWQANYRLGEFYLHLGKLADGISWMEKANSLQPSNYVAGYDLALAYYQLHQYDKAQRQISSMLTAQETAELHALLADVHEGGGDYVKAAREYQAAAKLDPSEENIFNWATELIVHQAYRPSIEILNRGASLFPKSIRMSVGLGIALYLDQQYEPAIKRLCVSTDISPPESWPYVFLGASYAGMAARVDSDEVKKHLQRFASLQPQNPQALFYYAAALWDRNRDSDNDRSSAESLLKRAVALDPSYVDAHLQLGLLYADAQDDKKTIYELSCAVQINPNLAAARYHLAAAYRRIGDGTRATLELQTFVRLHKQETEASESERNRITQFVVKMKADNSLGN